MINVRRQPIVMAAACVFPLLCLRPIEAHGQDEIDRLSRQGQLPADIRPLRVHSDFTDPVGRFMDMVAAGGLSEAKALQPDACNAWATRRERSAIAGKFWVGTTEIDMDSVCGLH
jgi:hypothetical protein